MATTSDRRAPTLEPIRFEVIRDASVAATDEMAATLRRGAYSTKIKTRADICLGHGGQTRYTKERETGSQPINVPRIDIHTLGAGGGSVAWIDRGGALQVDPRSPGADPGPACYGRGGEELTVTDANLDRPSIGWRKIATGAVRGAAGPSFTLPHRPVEAFPARQR